MYRDLPEASEWASEFESNIASYGFTPEQIFRYTNPNARTFYRVIQREVLAKVRANSAEGRKTLVVCFFAGHGAQNITYSATSALCNTAGKSNLDHYELENFLRSNLVAAGAYVIGLFACSRMEVPTRGADDGDDEESKTPTRINILGNKRGGTEETTVPQKGSAIIIHACSPGDDLSPETPSLASEFFDQLRASTSPGESVLLPGNMTYWLPCTLHFSSGNVKSVGTKNLSIHEPIHFFGPSPDYVEQTEEEQNMEA